MNPKKVAQNNVMFFVAAVGMSLGTKYFAQAVLQSSMEMSQFPTDNVGHPGYIKIDSSAVKKKGDDFWHRLADQVKNDLLTKTSYEFSSATEFEGDLAEQVTIKKYGYVFSFHIKQYERDAGHDFEIINLEELDDVPEDEKLGRVVYLTIQIAD